MHNCTPSLLDHIYTNDNFHYLYPSLLPLDIGDQIPSFLLIKFSRNKQLPYGEDITKILMWTHFYLI